MDNSIRFNLLPYREMRRDVNRMRFFVFVGVMLVCGAGAVFIGHKVFDRMISFREERNEFITKSVSILDQQLGEIGGLQKQTERLLARKDVIESLEHNRGETIQLLSLLVKAMPEGVILSYAYRKGDDFSIKGTALSTDGVSSLMRNLGASGLLLPPTLKEVRVVRQRARTLSEFAMDSAFIRKVETVDTVDPKAKKKRK